MSLSVDSTGAVKSIKTFNDEVEKVPASAKKADGAVGGLRKVFADFTSGLSFGAGFAAAQRGFGMIVSGAKDAATAVLKYADTIVTLHQRTGLSINSLQAFNAIAKTSGTDLDSLAKASVKLADAVGKGNPAFQKLGISLNELKAMSPDAAFAKVGQAIGGIENPMQRAAAAVAIFGRAGAEMLPLFATNMADASKQAKEFGLILDKDMLESVESLGDAVDLMGMAWDAFLMRMAGMVAQSPAVMGFVGGLSRLFGEMSAAVDGGKASFETFAREGVGAVVDSMGLAIKGVNLFIGIWDSLVIIQKAVQIAFLATGRAVMELLNVMAYLPGGSSALRKEWQSRIADAKHMQEELRKEQEEIKKTREARNLLVDSLAGRVSALKYTGAGSAVGGSAGGGGSFGGFGSGEVDQKAKAAANKAAELVFKLFELPVLQKFARENSNLTMAMPGIATSLSSPWLAGTPTKRGGSDPFSRLAGAGQGLMADPVFVSKMLSAYNEPVVKSSFSASQALQNLANIAQLSGSKLGKALAGIAGGGAGLAGGLSSLFGPNKTNFGSGLTGLLGKAGTYGQIAASSIGIVTSIFGLFKKKPKEPPPPPPKQATEESWRNFVTDQQSKGAAGVLAGVSGIKITTPEDMAAQASIASQSFWAMFKSQGLVKAADAFKAVRDKMVETFKAAGADDSAIAAMIGPMSGVVDLAGTEAFRGAADGANGFAQALASIANEQLPMSIDQFRAFEQQAVAGYEQMKAAAISQGMSSEDAIKTAIQGSGQLLTTLKDASAKYGIGLDGSKALFEQASAAGIAFGGSSQERLIMSIDRLTETLGGAPPKFEQAFAAGQVGSRISDGYSKNGMTDPGAIGDSIAAKLSGAFDRVAGVIAGLADRPIEVSSTINVDGNALAGSLASTLDGGGDGASRMRSALAGRG